MHRNIFDGIEALVALERFGTVSEAATRLRLTQSAVSKRIQALQKTVGYVVVRPEGRRLRLTDEGSAFLERARPLLAELREIASPVDGRLQSTLSLCLADSIASSWGPPVLAESLRGLPDLRVELHAHRSVLLVESIRLGRYHVGLTTSVPTGTDLVQCTIADEAMVLVPHGDLTKRAPTNGSRSKRAAAESSDGRSLGLRGRAAKRSTPGGPSKVGQSRKVRTEPGELPLITIEPSSATWGAIAGPLRRHHPDIADREIVPVESFSATLQMVRAGFGDGLLPIGIAIEAGLRPAQYRVLSRVLRPVSLVTRKTIYQTESFERLRDALLAATSRYFVKHGARAARPVVRKRAGSSR